MTALEIGDVFVQRSTQALWAVVQTEPEIVLRDPYGLRQDIIMSTALGQSPDFAAIFKFAWHYPWRSDRGISTTYPAC